ncbi:hypothetical protein HK102_012024 [Quaeritorhiza haematococci]|nr:hypothetical protein HK102_012024 [Quaeritorhiza haematococci]
MDARNAWPGATPAQVQSQTFAPAYSPAALGGGIHVPTMSQQHTPAPAPTQAPAPAATPSSAQPQSALAAIKRLNMIKQANEALEKDLDQKRQAIDVAFMMDLTGTMKRWLAQAKSKIIEIVDRLHEKYGDQAVVRVAFVGYADYDDRYNPPRSKKVHVDFGKGDDLIAFIADLEDKQFDGFDNPEDVLGGLDFVLKLKWWARTRLLIHIADDPPHNVEFHTYNPTSDRYAHGPDPSGRGPRELLGMLRELCNKSIDYHFFHLEENTTRMEQRFNEELSKYGTQLFVHKLMDGPDVFLPAVLKAIQDSRTRSWIRG